MGLEGQLAENSTSGSQWNQVGRYVGRTKGKPENRGLPHPGYASPPSRGNNKLTSSAEGLPFKKCIGDAFPVGGGASLSWAVLEDNWGKDT